MRQTEKTKVSFWIDNLKLQKLQEIYGIESITEIFNNTADEIITNGINVKQKKLIAPITRMGGKSMLADKIVAIMPRHKLFVDVFGGSGSILLAKPKEISLKEVINDKYDDIAILFEVIKKRHLELRKLVMSYPCSRRFYNELKKKEVITDPVEKAARFFYISRYSNFGDGRCGWNVSLRKDLQKTVQNIMDEILMLSQRLKSVVIESSDWAYILNKYQSDETLFYVDSPYIVKKNDKGIYELPFTKRDAYELQKQIHETKGLFMVSHYENALYNKWFNGWNKYQILL